MDTINLKGKLIITYADVPQLLDAAREEYERGKLSLSEYAKVLRDLKEIRGNVIGVLK